MSKPQRGHCICTIHNFAHEPFHNPQNSWATVPTSDMFVHPDFDVGPTPSPHALWDRHKNGLHRFDAVLQALMELAWNSHTNQDFVSSLRAIVSALSSFRATVLIGPIVNRSLGCFPGWSTQTGQDNGCVEDDDLGRYVYALQVMFTVWMSIPTVLPVGGPVSPPEAEAYLRRACAGNAPGERDRKLYVAIDDDDEEVDEKWRALLDDGVSGEEGFITYGNRRYYIDEAERGYVRVMRLCKGALCVLTRTRDGVVRYLDRVGSQLADEIEAERWERGQGVDCEVKGES